jgi:pre-mRNA-splicing factor 38A
MAAKDTTHRADARALLDDRGYTGRLIHGQNPALLFEKAVRDRITSSLYWMEQCYGLNEASLCDRAVELSCIGGTYGVQGKPTPFLCLAFKMCQLVPEREVVLEYLNWRDEEGERAEGENGEKEVNGEGEEGKKGDFKYLRALAAFYIRLAWEPVEVYKTLEPLLKDYRKLKRRVRDGFTLNYMDSFIDDLLTKERVCATSLQKLPKRETLEDLDLLEPREELDLDTIDQDIPKGSSSESYQSEGEASESEDD